MLDIIRQRRADLEKALGLAKAHREKAVAAMQASMAAVDKVQGALDEVKRLEALFKDPPSPRAEAPKSEGTAGGEDGKGAGGGAHGEPPVLKALA